MNFTSLGCVSWFSQMLLSILFQSFSTVLNSLNSFWRGHPIWLQLYDHHECPPNSDTVPRSNSYRGYNEASIQKRWNQCLNLFEFQCQVGPWQGWSLWRRKSGRVWIAAGARLQWNMSNSALENFLRNCEAIISCTFIILSGRNWQELMKRESKFQALTKEGGAIWFAKQPCKRRQTTSENSEVSAFHIFSQCFAWALLGHHEAFLSL